MNRNQRRQQARNRAKHAAGLQRAQHAWQQAAKAAQRAQMFAAAHPTPANQRAAHEATTRAFALAAVVEIGRTKLGIDQPDQPDTDDE